MRLSALWPALLPPCLVLGACLDTSAETRRFHLEGIRPSDGRGVYLNEELVLTFSDELDPTSITGQSLRVLSKAGRQARGAWEVTGNQARFTPAPVLSASLDDGGYQPGTEYELRVLGYPRIDGLRSTSGIPLTACMAWHFRTVDAGEAQPGLVFADASPGMGRLVKLDLADSLRPGEPLILECAEPLDPTTLVGQEFTIESADRTRGGHSCSVKARFLENHPQGSRGALQPCARIELLPVERLEPGNYLLNSVNVSLSDFQGNPVWPAVYRLRPLPFQVRRGPRSPTAMGPGEAALQLSFLDRLGFLSVGVPGSDGLAHWGDTGTLRVRFPAAAGSGALGELVLSGAEHRPDLHTFSALIPEGETLTLDSGPGLSVLRSQGLMTISGSLERRLAGRTSGTGPEDVEHPYAAGQALSQWLAKAAQEDWDWTVLIAGGDLIVRGEIDVDTPLLLVAGGWIRVEGRVNQARGQLWLLREGGGLRLDPTASVPDMIMDAPIENPLRAPLTYAAVTSPLPSQVLPYAWLDAEVGARRGMGRWQVRFLPPHGPVSLEHAVTHPRLLDSGGQLRVLFELTVPPGGAWDPPSIDYVNLIWRLGG